MSNNQDFIEPNKRENIILSTILFDEDCREYAMQNKINSAFFKNKRIKQIIEVFNGLFEHNITPTPEVIIEQMFPRETNETRIKKIELRQSFEKLRKGVPPVPIDVFKTQLNLLIEQAKLEDFQKLLQDTLKRTSKDLNKPTYKKSDETLNFLLSEIEKNLEKFSEAKIKSCTLSEGLEESVSSLEDYKKNPEKYKPLHITTGYQTLDKPLSGGFPRSEFSIISARPSVGKTVVMLNMAIEAALKGEKVLFLSVEMSLVQCLQRLLSKVSEVQLQKILQPQLLANVDMTTLRESVSRVARLYGQNLLIEEVKGLTPQQLRTRIKHYQKLFGVELVFVDYVQIMRTNSGKVPVEVSDYNTISDSLMTISGELDVAIVVGSQLSREVESRQDKRPMDSDLRNSGRFEQDAALIIHLYRDEIYNKDTENKKEIEFIIGKNRFGEGSKTLYFSHDYSIQTIYEDSRGAHSGSRGVPVTA